MDETMETVQGDIESAWSAEDTAKQRGRRRRLRQTSRRAARKPLLRNQKRRMRR